MATSPFTSTTCVYDPQPLEKKRKSIDTAGLIGNSPYQRQRCHLCRQGPTRLVCQGPQRARRRPQRRQVILLLRRIFVGFLVILTLSYRHGSLLFRRRGCPKVPRYSRKLTGSSRSRPRAAAGLGPRRVALIWPAAEHGAGGFEHDDDEFDDYDFEEDQKQIEAEKEDVREEEGQQFDIITSTSSCIPQSPTTEWFDDVYDTDTDQEFPSAQPQPSLYLSPPESSQPHALSSPSSTYLPSAQPNRDLFDSMPSYPNLELASTWQDDYFEEEYFEEESFFTTPPVSPPSGQHSSRMSHEEAQAGELDKVVQGMARVSMAPRKS